LVSAFPVVGALTPYGNNLGRRRLRKNMVIALLLAGRFNAPRPLYGARLSCDIEFLIREIIISVLFKSHSRLVDKTFTIIRRKIDEAEVRFAKKREGKGEK